MQVHPAQQVQPPHPSQLRYNLCQQLTGKYEGQSIRMATGVPTIWQDVNMTWSNTDGKIIGEGSSLWKDQLIKFKLHGCFNKTMDTVELIKIHGEDGKGTVVHYQLKIMRANNDPSKYKHY